MIWQHRQGVCDGLIVHLNPYSGCPLWPIFTSLPCNYSTGQTPPIFLITKISHFTGSAHSSGDLYPLGLLAFENVVQISHILEKPSKNLAWSPGGFGRGERLGQRPHQMVLPCHAINLLLIRGGFDRQPIAKNHKKYANFPNICPTQHVTLDILVWGWKTHSRTQQKITHKFLRAGTRHPRWDCWEAISILGLNLNCAPLSNHSAPEHHPLCTQCLGWPGLALTRPCLQM